MMKLGGVVLVALLAACGPGPREGGGGDGDEGDSAGDSSSDGDNPHNGELPATCADAEANHSSVGCDYYAVDMDGATTPAGPPTDACFALFVANTSDHPAHMQIDWGTLGINLASYAKLPQGEGQSLTYANFDPTAGIPVGKVAIVFLAYAPGSMNVKCPVPAAIGTAAQIGGTGMGTAFHLKTDVPVVAYQMLPYGGGAAAATGASLLLPTSAWGTNYITVTAYDVDNGAPPIAVQQGPSFNVVAMEDNTSITMKPFSKIVAGGGMAASPAGMPYTFSLNKGQYAQFTQYDRMTGSPFTSDKPVGLFGGHQIMSIDRCCGDHGEQMIAPVKALGWIYVAAPHGDRKPTPGEERIYRVIGAVNGTQLVYDPPVGGPATLNKGQIVEIRSSTPFVVNSQDADHPFLAFTYMSGAGEQEEGGWGDADFVRLVPPAQFLKHYVFFADPTYPFTTLTVVRQRMNGAFKDVTIDCMDGPLTGWQDVGVRADFQITHVKLVDHWNGQNGCNNGVRNMNSENNFGLWVWGWGSEDTHTGWVSYGYPAGEGVDVINDVIVQ